MANGLDFKMAARSEPCPPATSTTLRIPEKSYASTATSACADDCDPTTSGGEFYLSEDGGLTWDKGTDWTTGGSGGGWMALVAVHVVAP